MNIDTLHEHLDAEFGGPAFGAIPRFSGDALRPHKGGGGSSTTTQSIPQELKPLASAYATKAMDLSNQPYQPYWGQQVAGMNDFQNSATARLGQIFNNGDSSMNAARNAVTAGLTSGSAATKNPYSGSNPYLQQNIDAAMGDITRNYNDAIAPGLTTQMVNSGSFGNTGNQAATQNSLNDLTKNLANTASNMRMQDYTAQQQLAENYANRNDQMKSQMLGLAPGYESQGMNVANNFMNAANMYQDNQQQQLDTQYQSFLDQQNLPYKQLAAMSGVFGSGIGQTSTTKSSGGGK
ncbi:hypothetical protein KVG96_14525 [Pseudomonas sp. COR58]|uniref:Uncharacterized protein n=1 Tax=Pseudomonas ekonensis TaxID=2842353 RepID=A0ABS6PFB5_9PSED|nr:hypothetical protein [Pseudomonas ekonensis]MBV4459172.1 hypothetical protein [Pseudomonas ekonensis]